MPVVFNAEYAISAPTPVGKGANRSDDRLNGNTRQADVGRKRVDEVFVAGVGHVPMYP